MKSHFHRIRHCFFSTSGKVSAYAACQLTSDVQHQMMLSKSCSLPLPPRLHDKREHEAVEQVKTQERFDHPGGVAWSQVRQQHVVRPPWSRRKMFSSRLDFVSFFDSIASRPVLGARRRHTISLSTRKTGVKTWQHTFRSTKSGQVVNDGTFQRHLRWPTQHTKESTSRRMFLTCNSLRNAFCPLSPFPVPPGGIFSSTIEASGVADSTAVSPWYAHTHKANSLFHKDTAGAVQLRYQCEPPSRLQSINDQTPVCVCETRTVSFRSA